MLTSLSTNQVRMGFPDRVYPRQELCPCIFGSSGNRVREKFEKISLNVSVVEAGDCSPYVMVLPQILTDRGYFFSRVALKLNAIDFQGAGFCAKLFDLNFTLGQIWSNSLLQRKRALIDNHIPPLQFHSLIPFLLHGIFPPSYL